MIKKFFKNVSAKLGPFLRTELNPKRLFIIILCACFLMLIFERWFAAYVMEARNLKLAVGFACSVIGIYLARAFAFYMKVILSNRKEVLDDLEMARLAAENEEGL